MGGEQFDSIVTIVAGVVILFLTILWVILPFVVMSIKGRLDRLIELVSVNNEITLESIREDEERTCESVVDLVRAIESLPRGSRPRPPPRPDAWPRPSWRRRRRARGPGDGRGEGEPSGAGAPRGAVPSCWKPGEICTRCPADG